MVTKVELEAANEALERRIDALSKPITDFADERLAPLWEAAGKVADDNSYCDQFDTIVNVLGGIPRRQQFYGSIIFTVTAQNKHEAREMLHGIRAAIQSRIEHVDETEVDEYSVEEV